MKIKSDDFKCVNCAGQNKFDPKTSMLRCTSCGNSVKLPALPAKEEDYETALEKEAENNWDNFAHSYKCDSCGAVQILNNGSLADVCPFCGSSNIADSNNLKALTPNAILPFALNEDEARKAILERAKKSFWAPKNLISKISLDSLKGIYTPTYTFDFKISGSYSGRFGKSTERAIRMREGELRTVTEIKWFNASGDVAESFNDILIDAGQVIKGAALRGLEPFATDSAICFNKKYLCGYIANEAGKKLEAAKKQAEIIANDIVRERIKEKNFAEYVEKLNLSVEISNIKFKYILLPVYKTNFEYHGKIYNQYVNGSSGKVAGRLPFNRRKLWAIILGSVLFAAGAAAVIKFLFL